MKSPATSLGPVYIWQWGDDEIDHPKDLKSELDRIKSRGFSGVLVTLTRTRYEFMNRHVLRTIAQVSQWAKVRHLHFKFQVDPRQASRHLINQTGERVQTLLTTRRPGQMLKTQKPHIAKVENNHFSLKFQFPRYRPEPALQETAVNYAPSGLEAAFLFQMDQKRVIKSSLRQMSHQAHFFTDVQKGFCEVFGKVWVPEDETWWVAAFPKFNTNCYDFAGRESNDLLLMYVEDLFDACTHLDGVTWGHGSMGYLTDLSALPVSESLFNAFKSEYGYDLRKSLYALILDVDDDSHIRVRSDYYNLLADAVRLAQNDFHQMIHSFFPGYESGIHHAWPLNSRLSNHLPQGSVNPWKLMPDTDAAFGQAETVSDILMHQPVLMSGMAITKSMGLFSKERRAYFDIGSSELSPRELAFWSDVTSLYSLRWTHHYMPDAPDDSLDLNHRLQQVANHTNYNFPISNVLMIYPAETIIARGSDEADAMMRVVHQLIARLIFSGIQMDIVSSDILKEGRLSARGFRIRNHIYDAVLYPYPEVMTADALEIVSLMDTFGFPILLGGSKPAFFPNGKRIPHTFVLAFDPESKDLSQVLNSGVKPLMDTPDNSIASLIHQVGETLFLIAPQNPGQGIEGPFRYKHVAFDVPRGNRLMMFSVKNGKKDVKQIL